MNWLREKLATKVRDEEVAEASRAAKAAAKAEGNRSVFEVAQQETKPPTIDSTAQPTAPIALKHSKKRKQVKKAHSVRAKMV